MNSYSYNYAEIGTKLCQNNQDKKTAETIKCNYKIQGSRENLAIKNVPNFYWVAFKQSYKKNPLRIFIWMQKFIEFYLPHYEISQL